MKLEGTTKDNVFDFNDGIEYLDICENLIVAHGREKASDYFWAMYLVYHPESKIFHSKLSDKKKSVMKTHLKSKKDFDSIFAPHVKLFIQEFVNDPIAKMLALVRIKFDEYFDSVMFLDFDVKISKDKKLLIQASKLKDLKEYNEMIEEYDETVKKYVEKKDIGSLYKGISESVRERRYRIGKPR